MTTLNLDAVFASFCDPADSARPTPFYWWSGADLTRETLERHLDTLAEKGIGGTIIGYSHKTDGTIDHGSPAPLTTDWWDLFRWYVDASSQRGMTVGFQDYGFIGPALAACGARTTGLNAGTLKHQQFIADAAAPVEAEHFGAAITAVAWPVGDEREEARVSIPLALAKSEGWLPDNGQWHVSVVTSSPRKIGTLQSAFDPLHPESGAALIEHYYERFASELGKRLGKDFVVFFQDELDFGLTMPFWNDRVRSRLESANISVEDELDLLWNDGERSAKVRDTYRNAVVEILEDSYFKPIFEWHENHGTSLVMDQVARGDLRLGHHHYADFLQTMKWYQGPGNDDPDLTGPRNLAAFRVSASIARQWGRPLVANEGFHSSGWGVTPQDVLAGANIGFAAGANMLILHGLNYTTQQGWWEWASPDFHFRQPWWEFSEHVWQYFSRVAQLLRSGTAEADICIVDPTPDLDLIGEDVRSPERTQDLLDHLTRAGYAVDVASAIDLRFNDDTGKLKAGHADYSAVIQLSHALPAAGRAAIQDFRERGGLVIDACERDASYVSEELDRALPLAFTFYGAELLIAKRRIGTLDVYFIVNPLQHSQTALLSLASEGATESWDPWTCSRTSLGDGPTSETVTLAAGGSHILIHDRGNAGGADRDAPLSEPDLIVAVSEEWEGKQKLRPLSDDRLDDIGIGSGSTGVQSWRFRYQIGAQRERATTVGQRTRFLALGPLSLGEADKIEDAIVQRYGHADAAAPEGWRKYRYSMFTGPEDDPHLRDRMTGPHGLKGVPSTFIVPSVLDAEPEPGTVYFFWTTVGGHDEVEPVWFESRAAARVWVDGDLVISQDETLAATFDPWDLQDMSTETRSAERSVRTGSRLLLRLDVASDQPTRAGVAVGGRPSSSPSRLKWWAGDAPALEFAIPSDAAHQRASVIISAPPGAAEAILRPNRPLLQATQDGEPLPVNSRHDGAIVLPLKSRSDLHVSLEAGHADEGDLLSEPIQWTPGWTPAVLTSWADIGLADYSGLMEYRLAFAVDATTVLRAELVFNNVAAACHVTLNGQPIGHALRADTILDATEAIVSGSNTIEVTVANTLANFYRHLPSPYATMQTPGGGIGDVTLRIWA